MVREEQWLPFAAQPHPRSSTQSQPPQYEKRYLYFKTSCLSIPTSQVDPHSEELKDVLCTLKPNISCSQEGILQERTRDTDITLSFPRSCVEMKSQGFTSRSRCLSTTGQLEFDPQAPHVERERRGTASYKLPFSSQACTKE